MITRKCKRGTFSFLETDMFIGKSLNEYGEYGENEIWLMEQVLKPGDIAMDVGANIGTLTVPMAQLVGPEGHVYAWEPGGNNLPVLERNIKQNNLNNVTIVPCCASDKEGDVEIAQIASLHLWRRPEEQFLQKGPVVTAPTKTIDSLNLPRLNFLKIDVDGMEVETIVGMHDTIRRCRPVIYIENEQEENAAEVIAALTARAYRMWWWRPPQFNPNNFKSNPNNFFGQIISIMMLAIPAEWADVEIKGMDEVADIRDDDDMFNREIARYQYYTNMHPNDAWARLFLAHNLNLMQRCDEADAEIAEGLRRNPDHMALCSLKALIDLQRGNFEDGWKGSELRFKRPDLKGFGGHRKKPFDMQAPQWDGKPTDKRLLIWAEQGFGDQIMFARFMPMILERAPNAMLECNARLFELFEQSNIVPPGQLYRLHRKLPEFDLQCSLVSAMSILNVTREEITKYSAPYLRAEPELVKEWKDRIIFRKIGVCDKGSANSERPLTRDCPRQQFDKLMKLDHGPFYDLVQGRGGSFENFADTAACMMALDLIITVDTSVAHLAGALGRPVWLLLSTDPDWRWGLKGDSSIWYPSLRIFRQPKFRDWDAVIADVSAALNERRNIRMQEAA